MSGDSGTGGSRSGADERVLAVARAVVDAFGPFAGFVLVVHDPRHDPRPLVCDNYAARSDARDLLMAVAPEYGTYQTRTYDYDPAGNDP